MSNDESMALTPRSIKDTGRRPKVSVVLGCRNEYPQVVHTMHSFQEELEFWGYPFEIIVVDNMSTDNTPWILRDKYRRWIREKPPLLKVVEYNDAPANVLVRNIGARKADGEVVFLSDGHISVKIGTCHGMIQGWLQHGGLWHSAIHIFGDTTSIRCFGYDLRLKERFWGNLSRGIPDEAYKDGVPYPYTVPMASHCALMAGREEFLDKGGYNEDFKCYGGGEPYLDLKWWLLGGKVWIFPEGLMRHSYGINARWEKAGKGRMNGEERKNVEEFFRAEESSDKPEKVKENSLRKMPRAVRQKALELYEVDSSIDDKIKQLNEIWPKILRTRVQCKDGSQKSELNEGDEYLRYSRGYAWTNDWFQFNFMLAAYCIGGYKWFQQRYESYLEGRRGNPRYVEDILKMRQEVLKVGAKDRKFIESRQIMSLDELIEKNPWHEFAKE